MRGASDNRSGMREDGSCNSGEFCAKPLGDQCMRFVFVPEALPPGD